MNILHSRAIWLGLTEIWIYNQVRHLPDTVTSHILSDQRINKEQFDHPNLHLTATNPPQYAFLKAVNRYDSARAKLFRKLVQDNGITLVHSHFGPEGWRNHRLAADNNVAHVVTFYGYDIGAITQTNPEWFTRYREMFAAVDAVLCEGPFMAQTIVEYLGCPPEKSRVHRLGVELSHIAFQPRQRKADEPLRILMAASFTPKKGFPDALQALGNLAQNTPIAVTIIGDASDDPNQQSEKSRMLQVITDTGITDDVQFLGYQPHQRMIAEAHKHHVFLSPSVTAPSGDTEGGAPVALIEMAATGMPIISTTHCDIPQVVIHGETGFLADEHDPAQLTEFLRWLDQHPEQWATMGEKARAHIEQHFDAAQQGKNLATLYTEILEARQDNA